LIFPVLTKELAVRLEKAETEYMVSRVKAIARREGNPMGAELREFGGATALYVREMPWGAFNAVKGLGAADKEHLDGIIEFYRERNRPFQLEITPVKGETGLFSGLAERGFFQSGFHATLYGIPARLPADVDTMEPERRHDIRIRLLEEEEFGLYGKLHCLGTGLPENGYRHVEENNRVLAHDPEWRYYIGYVDGQPAGVAVMHIRPGETASMTFAATLPEFRRRGLQTAFLRRRLQDAASAQCELAAGQAAYASVSHNNMERAGLRLAYTRVTWTRKP
jgi:ribosomal protein S18 acetylase RimI-like enzyme